MRPRRRVAQRSVPSLQVIPVDRNRSKACVITDLEATLVRGAKLVASSPGLSRPPPYPPPQAGEDISIYPPPLAGEGRAGAAQSSIIGRGRDKPGHDQVG